MGTEVHAGIKILKGILYVLSRVAIVGAVAALIVVAYYTAVNTMTVDMIVKEAFARRAAYGLMPSPDGSDMPTIEKLFTQKAIEGDEILTASKYHTSDYTINEYYERTDIPLQLIWMWEDEATIEVEEIVLDISASSNLTDAEGHSIGPDVPEWDNGIYKVRVVKSPETNGWLVDDVTFVERVLATPPAPAEEAEPRQEAAAEQEADPAAAANADVPGEG